MASVLTQYGASLYRGPVALPVIGPNLLVRCAFYFALFAVPFGRIYLPGTAERLGVTRLAQLLIVAAILSQPRICIRQLPVAILFFLGYCCLRMGMGVSLSPNLAEYWGNTTFDLMQMLFVCWFIFNVLQQPRMAERGLRVFIAGAAVCAVLHVLDIGTVHLAPQGETRISVFGENANVVATTYAVALIAAMGLLIHSRNSKSTLCLLLPAVASMAGGIALTGSRTGALLPVVGMLILLLPIKPARWNGKTLVLLVLIAGIFAGILYRVPIVTQRAKDSLAVGMDDEPRKKMFPVLLEIYLRSPIYGHGPDTYREELTWRAMPHLIIRKQQSTTAHNVVLLTLVETGIIGFSIFAGGLLLALKGAWKARGGPLRLIPLGLVLPLVAVSAITGTPHYTQGFWVAIAYALSAPQHCQKGASCPTV